MFVKIVLLSYMKCIVIRFIIFLINNINHNNNNNNKIEKKIMQINNRNMIRHQTFQFFFMTASIWQHI